MQREIYQPAKGFILWKSMLGFQVNFVKHDVGFFYV